MNFTRPFAKMLEGLPAEPVIVEIGCAHAPEGLEAASQGWSTLAFVNFVREHGGIVHSIDIDPEHTKRARKIVTSHFNEPVPELIVYVGDARKVIEEQAFLRIDLLYVDGGVGGDEAAAQVRAALFGLRHGFGRVAFDDCPTDDIPEHWANPELRVSTVWANPEKFGLRLEWRESVCVAFRTC